MTDVFRIVIAELLRFPKLAHAQFSHGKISNYVFWPTLLVPGWQVRADRVADGVDEAGRTHLRPSSLFRTLPPGGENRRSETPKTCREQGVSRPNRLFRCCLVDKPGEVLSAGDTPSDRVGG